MEDKKGFRSQDAETEPSGPLFAAFRPKPKPAPAPKPAPQPDKAARPDPRVAGRVEKLAGEGAALSARLDAAAKAALTREEAEKLLDPLRRELAGAARERTEALQGLQKRLEEIQRADKRLAELENSQKRVDALEKSQPRIDALERSQQRIDELEKSRERLQELDRLQKRVEELERAAAEAAKAGLAERLEKLAKKTSAISARQAAAEGGITCDEAGKLLDPLRRELAGTELARADDFKRLSGRIGELERKLADVCSRPPSRPDACLGIRVEELAAQLTALAARIDAASWSRSEEVRKLDKRAGELGDGFSAALAESAGELSGKIGAIFADLDGAAWARGQESQKANERMAELEKALSRLSAQLSRLGLEGRVDKLAAELTALSARIDAAAWARAEELEKSRTRIDALEREIVRLSARQSARPEKDGGTPGT